MITTSELIPVPYGLRVSVRLHFEPAGPALFDSPTTYVEIVAPLYKLKSDFLSFSYRSDHFTSSAILGDRSFRAALTERFGVS